MVQPLTPLIRRANDVQNTFQPLLNPGQQDEQSLLATIGHTGLSAISKVGNLLDLPGSMVRDTLTWLPGGPDAQNPFDQILSPLSHENRATGRDVLSQFGMRENKETGFVPFEDPGEFARDAAGIVTEIALDPLGWWAGWASKGTGSAARYAAQRQNFGPIRRTAGKIGTAWEAVDPSYKIGRMLAGRYRTFRQPQRAALLDNKVRPFVQNILKNMESTTGDVEGIAMNADEIVDAWDVVNEATARTWVDNNPGVKIDDWYGKEAKVWEDFVNTTWEDFVAKGLNKKSKNTMYSAGADLPDFESLAQEIFPVSSFDDPKFTEELSKIVNTIRSTGGVKDQQVERLVSRAAEIEFKAQAEAFWEISDTDAWRIMISDVADARGIDEDAVGDFVRTRSGMDQLMPGRLDDYAGQLSRFLREVNAPGDTSVDALIRDGEDLIARYEQDEDLFYGVFAAANDRFSKNEDAIYERLNEAIAGSDDFQDVLYQRAWHGSKSKNIEKFSTEHIGSGEGAAVHGYGLYYSSNVDAAERIRTNISDADFKYKGESVPRMLHEAKSDQERILSELANTLAYNEDFASATSLMKLRHPEQSTFIDSLSRQDFSIKKGGALYAADIPDDDILLDLNKSLSGQPRKVKTALKSVLGGDYSESLKGSDAYDVLKQKTGSAKAASELLDKSGVKGARVLDDYSASPGFGQPEYVIFNGDNVTVDGKFANIDEARRFSGAADDADTLYQMPDELGGGRFSRLKPTHIKPEVAPVWYSKLSATIGEKVGGKVGMQQLKSTLKSAGVKDEEIEWANLDELFDGKKSVSKDELQTWVDENAVKVEDVWLGEKYRNPRRDPESGLYDDDFDSMPQYEDYSSLGGENYRELLLTLPTDNAAKYQSEHFPDTESILAWLRMQDRVGADGSKILHVDEIQSDWHQAGREQGYMGVTAEARIAELRASHDSLLAELESLITKRESMLAENNPEVMNIGREVRNARLRVQESSQKLLAAQKGVPNAPFKKTWHELAIKRALRVAAEEGYDRLSINSGQTVINLEMGGVESGLKKFYDEVYPNALNKLVKKHGLRVEKNSVPIHEFSDDYAKHLAHDMQKNQSIIDNLRKGNLADPDAEYYISVYNNNVEGAIAGIEGLVRWSKNHLDALHASSAHSIPITPELRQSLLSEPQALFQKAQAATDDAFVPPKGAVKFDPQTDAATVFAFQGAGIDTLFHETGHVFRRQLPNISPSLMRDAEKAYGVARGANWSVDQEEQFTEDFTAYLAEGLAPTKELQAVFGNFKNWMSEIYKSIRHDPEAVSPEVRSIFDGMLADADNVTETLARYSLGKKPSWEQGSAVKGNAAKGEAGVEGAEQVQDAGRVAGDDAAQPGTGGAETLLQPGKPIGAAAESAVGDQVRRFTGPSKEAASKVIAAARSKFRTWLNKYDVPHASPAELEADLDIMKREKAIHPDAVVVNQLSPVQLLARRAVAGLGGDLNFYGGTGNHKAAGISLRDGSNRVWVNADKPDGGVFDVFSHEMLHLMSNSDPDAFRQLTTNLLSHPEGKEILQAGLAKYPGKIPTGGKVEEAMAMLMGAAGENPEVWKLIAQDTSVAPYFQRIFDTVVKKLGKRLTSREQTALEQELFGFMFEQRDQMAKGATPESLAAKGARMKGDSAFVRNFAQAADRTAPYSPEKNLMQALGFRVDDAARNTAQAAVDIYDRIARSLSAQFNYKVLGRLVSYNQDAAKDATEFSERIKSSYMEPVNAIQEIQSDLGLIGDLELNKAIRQAIETENYQILPEAFQAPVVQLRQVLANVHSMSRSVGLKDQVLQDVIDYFPRTAEETIAAALREGAKKSSGSFESEMALVSNGRRADLTRGYLSGTEELDSMVSDSRFHELIRGNRHEEAGDYLRASKNAQGTIDPRLPQRNNRGDYVIDEYVPEMDEAGEIIGYKDEFVRKTITQRELATKYESDALTREQLLGMSAEERMAHYQEPITYTPKEGSDETFQPFQLVTHNEDPSLPDKFAAVSKWVSDTGITDYIQKNGGIFRTNSLLDAQTYINNAAHRIGIAASIPKLMSRLIDDGLMMTRNPAAGIRRRGVTLSQFLKHDHYSHLDEGIITQAIMKQSKEAQKLVGDGVDGIEDLLKGYVVPEDIFNDLIQAGNASEMPRSLDGLAKLHNSFTALFKAGVLTAPARYTRDLTSAMVALWTRDRLNWGSFKSALNVQFRKDDAALTQIPALKDFALRNGLMQQGQDFTPKLATQSARAFFASLRRNSAQIFNDVDYDALTGVFNPNAAAEAMAETLPGTGHTSAASMGLDVLKNTFNLGNLNPKRWMDVEGVQYFTSDKARKGMIRRKGQEGFEQLPLVEAGNILGKNFDEIPRMAGFIEGMKRGLPPEQAFDEINKLLLDYRPETFGPIERKFLKKIFPFYSFFSRQSLYLTHELINNPAGRLGQMIRVQRHGDNSAGEDGQYVPEHVRSEMAVPWSDSTDGGKTYLTGFGLMHEDPLSTIFGGLTDPQFGARELVSKANPLIKGIAEFGLGVSSFQGGPLGGRDLADMDPTLGRIFTQLGIQEEIPGNLAAPAFGSRTLEFALANSPLARALTSLRTALDDRKTEGQIAANLLTGFRFTTVSPEQSRSALREVTDAMARDSGARSFETFHMSEEFLDQFKDSNPEVYQKLKAVTELRSIWAKQNREKRKQEAAMSQQETPRIRRTGLGMLGAGA